MKRGVLICVVALVAAVPAFGATNSNSANVLKVFRKQIASIKKSSKVPVILPASLPFGGKVPKLYPVGGGTKNSWTLVLTGSPNCGGPTRASSPRSRRCAAESCRPRRT